MGGFFLSHSCLFLPFSYGARLFCARLSCSGFPAPVFQNRLFVFFLKTFSAFLKTCIIYTVIILHITLIITSILFHFQCRFRINSLFHGVIHENAVVGFPKSAFCFLLENIFGISENHDHFWLTISIFDNIIVLRNIDNR